MPSYAPLIAEWPNLTGTTAQKLATLNAMTVTGTIPTLFYVSGAQIINCINYAEFVALTAAQQTQVLMICAMAGPLAAGSSLPFVSKFFATVFNDSGPTITAMVALAQGAVQPWWQANGFTAPIDVGDLQAAGGLS